MRVSKIELGKSKKLGYIDKITKTIGKNTFVWPKPSSGS